MDSVLDSLIAPISREIFFSDYWGTACLISRRLDGRLPSLFSWSVLSEILSTQRFDFPRLRIVRSGKVVPADKYMVQHIDRRGRPYVAHDSKTIAALLNAGCVLHMASVGEAWTPLALFAAQLETELCARVHVNLHAGFASSRGFDVHWDGHDVFAVQIEGRKRWRLFGFTEAAPTAIPPDQKHGAPNDSVWEGLLSAGDVLYIPRGFWHAAEALDDASLHLTFAVQHVTGLDFVNAVMGELGKHDLFRRDIPRAAFTEDAPGISKEEYLLRMVTAISGAVSTEALDRFVTEFRANLGITNHIELAPLPTGKE